MNQEFHQYCNVKIPGGLLKIFYFSLNKSFYRLDTGMSSVSRLEGKKLSVSEELGSSLK